MKKALVPMAILAGGLLAGAQLVGAYSAAAESGRIGFHGAIVEPACPASENGLHCPAGRPGSAVVRALDMRMAPHDTEPALLAYALDRDPTQPWRLVEVTYR
jgi:hypothetical protein